MPWPGRRPARRSATWVGDLGRAFHDGLFEAITCIGNDVVCHKQMRECLGGCGGTDGSVTTLDPRAPSAAAEVLRFAGSASSAIASLSVQETATAWVASASALGEVEAFVSHSWSDDGVKKHALYVSASDE